MTQADGVIATAKKPDGDPADWFKGAGNPIYDGVVTALQFNPDLPVMVRKPTHAQIEAGKRLTKKVVGRINRQGPANYQYNAAAEADDTGEIPDGEEADASVQ